MTINDQQLDDRAVHVLSVSGAMCGVCGDEPGDHNCADCERVRRGYIRDLRAAGWAPQEEHEALVDEVRRLRAELAAEQAQHAFTLRQRNNRSARLLQLRALANAGDTDALVAAALDTLAASRHDHTPDEAGEPMSEPSACRWCGIPQREHAQRWAKPVGWHKWEQPTQAQIKARMLARRAAQPVAEDNEGLSGPCDCGEGAVHYTDAECPAAQRTAAPAARSAAV